MLTSLGDLLTTKRVIVTVGCGDVGKTTIAAALALAAARQGRRVLCLTIDPAKRLATSLGLREMAHEAQEIDPALWRSEGEGTLTAMMPVNASPTPPLARPTPEDHTTGLCRSDAGAHAFAQQIALELG